MTMRSQNMALRVNENNTAIVTTANKISTSNRVLYNRCPHAFRVKP